MGYLIGWIVQAIICGIAAQAISESKGYDGGFAWGCLLGFIGLIVVACRPNKTIQNSSRGDQAGRDVPVAPLTWEDHDHELLSNGGWKCPKCGRVNAGYTYTCVCGMNKNETTSFSPKKDEQKETREKDEQELMNLKKLKAYKELLDSGAITQAEFEREKAKLLN